MRHVVGKQKHIFTKHLLCRIHSSVLLILSICPEHIYCGSYRYNLYRILYPQHNCIPLRERRWASLPQLRICTPDETKKNPPWVIIRICSYKFESCYWSLNSWFPFNPFAYLPVSISLYGKLHSRTSDHRLWDFVCPRRELGVRKWMDMTGQTLSLTVMQTKLFMASLVSQTISIYLPTEPVILLLLLQVINFRYPWLQCPSPLSWMTNE